MNYVLMQKGWKKPQRFSMSENKDERIDCRFPDGTNIIRQNPG